jgi:hypothetical protein
VGRSGYVVKKATHRVTCAVCGRNGSVVVKDNGEIADKKWSFFGKFNLNYKAAMPASGQGEPDYAGDAASPLEYWECEDCYRDVERILKGVS